MPTPSNTVTIKKIDDFYDERSTHSFRPLILQPSRVTTKTRTLIDNIYVNDLSSFSTGEKLTSISDHFGQFAQIDLFQSAKNKLKQIWKELAYF